jgi:hypothetical protein
MPSTESKLAETKVRHFRERDEFETPYAEEKTKLQADAKREIRDPTENTMDQAKRPPSHAGRRLPSIAGIEKDVKQKLETALADVDVRRAAARKPLDARHKAEIVAVSRGNPPRRRPNGPAAMIPFMGFGTDGAVLGTLALDQGQVRQRARGPRRQAE